MSYADLAEHAPHQTSEGVRPLARIKIPSVTGSPAVGAVGDFVDGDHSAASTRFEIGLREVRTSTHLR